MYQPHHTNILDHNFRAKNTFLPISLVDNTKLPLHLCATGIMTFLWCHTSTANTFSCKNASIHNTQKVTDSTWLPWYILQWYNMFHHSILFQYSPSNGTFKSINHVQVLESPHYFHYYQYKPNQVMFNNLDKINVITNSNDEEMTIPHSFYTMGEIIPILNIMTHTTCSIST